MARFIIVRKVDEIFAEIKDEIVEESSDGDQIRSELI